MTRRISVILRLSAVLVIYTFNLTLIRPAQAASWVTNGPLHTARYGHTATLLSNGKVLVVGGYVTNGIILTSAELYDPTTGVWADTGSLNTARYGHTATLLPNGKVLVVGGIDIFSTSNAELYDPATKTWTPTSPDPVSCHAHTATLLPNGKVLVVGGYGFDPFSPLSSAMLYDPSTETWTDAGAMKAGHVGHTATLLPNGKVLVTGGAMVGFGVGESVTNTVELYNPADGTWTLTGSLNTARAGHTATLLPNGQVLVAGGHGTNGTLDSAELYDPSNETWMVTGSLNMARFDHSAALLPNGTVLVAGGEYSDINTNFIISAAELYSPSDGTWTPTASLNNGRNAHTATVLPSGNVLITGGMGTNGIGFIGFPATGPISSVEVYDYANGMWTATGSLNTARKTQTATLLPNGKVLIAGGFGNTWLASAELFDPITEIWTTTNGMNSARSYHTATVLSNGKVLVAGGQKSIGSLAGAELFDFATGLWTNTRSMNNARCSHSATLLSNGKVLVAGGGISSGSISSAEIYDPVNGTWTNTGTLNSARAVHTATLLLNGKVLVAGGYANSSYLSSAELYDPVRGIWSNTGSMNIAREHHTATLLPDGKVLVTGGNNTIVTNSAELYDPITGRWTMTGSMSSARAYHTAILLSDGKVLVAGGQSGFSFSSLTTSSELYDPVTGNWTTTGNMTTDHTYCTITLLLDGRVLVAGGAISLTASTPGSELFAAGFDYSNSGQPQIASLTSPLKLGSSLVITGAQFRGVSEGSGGNSQDSSTDYPLVQLRSIESEQTVFLSSTNWGTNSFTSLPVWNFPPGYALATVFVNGIQSTSAIVNISVPVPAATTLNSAATLNNGQFQFSFTNNPGALFGALATTNLSLPLTNWTRLGGVVEVAPGQFQFSDPQATNSGQRYYNLFAP